MQQIIICEDDPIQLVELEEHMKQCIQEEVEILSYISGKKLLNDLPTLSPSYIYLLDIMLKDENGIEVAKHINEVQPKSSIIFISAYLDLVTDIFDTRHCYFILKSDLPHRLGIAIHKAMDQQNQNRKILSLHDGTKKIILHTEDILYIERKIRVTYFHMETGIEKTTLCFDAISKYLPTYFQRCHNSFIVNFKAIKKLHRNELVVANDICIPISRAYQKKVKQKFEEYIMELV